MVDVGLSRVGATVPVRTVFASLSSPGTHSAQESFGGWIQGLMVSWFWGVEFEGLGFKV
jgi:hypothetical protein